MQMPRVSQQETTGTPMEVSEGKGDENTKHQLQAKKMHCHQQNEQPKTQIIKCRYNNQRNKTI